MAWLLPFAFWSAETQVFSPDRLVPAPAHVIKQVAAVDPSQVLQAELEFPPHVEQASQELATQVHKVEPEPRQMVNKPTRPKPTRRATLA